MYECTSYILFRSYKLLKLSAKKSKEMRCQLFGVWLAANGKHGIDKYGIGEHGIGEYGIGEHGIGEYGIGEYEIGEYGIGKHGIGRNRHGIGEHGIGEHGIGEYGIGEMLRHLYDIYSAASVLCCISAILKTNK